MPYVKSFSRIETDESMMENAQHGSRSYPLQYYYENIWQFDFHCVEWHWHSELEYVYVKTGEAICSVGDARFRLPEGQGILINSRILHRFEAERDTIIPNVVFSASLLAPEQSLLYQKYIQPLLLSGLGYQIFDPSVSWQDECIGYMNEVFRYQELDTPDEWQTFKKLLSFWEVLFRESHFETLAGPASSDTSHMRLQMMMQFIQEHYRENVSLEDIAGAVYVGKSTALQIFQHGIHLSPVAYLIEYRLRQAANMLALTEKTVETISRENGFQSTSYFCRKFRELYGLSPQMYRKNSRSKNVSTS